VQARLGVTVELIETNRTKLAALPEFRQRIVQARQLMDDERQAGYEGSDAEAEERVYDAMADDHDRNLMRTARAAVPTELGKIAGDFHDPRFSAMLPRYKARNFPTDLTSEERQAWEAYCSERLFAGGTESRLAQYFQKLAKCAEDPKYAGKQFLLEELQLYGQSLMPDSIE
jgi:exodeoxyribonuclease-1